MPRRISRKREFDALVDDLPAVEKVYPPVIKPARRRRASEADVRCELYLDRALHARLDAFCQRSRCWSVPWAITQMIEHCLDEADA